MISLHLECINNIIDIEGHDIDTREMIPGITRTEIILQVSFTAGNPGELRISVDYDTKTKDILDTEIRLLNTAS